ncbi:hypothetical protein BLOT_001509 [Blomia tropicalis]|nr:hypothetical protein BLOT_001509 [Blomia tropicalis]
MTRLILANINSPYLNGNKYCKIAKRDIRRHEHICEAIRENSRPKLDEDEDVQNETIQIGSLREQPLPIE